MAKDTRDVDGCRRGWRRTMTTRANERHRIEGEAAGQRGYPEQPQPEVEFLLTGGSETPRSSSSASGMPNALKGTSRQAIRSRTCRQSCAATMTAAVIESNTATGRLSRRCNRCNVARQPWQIWERRHRHSRMLLDLKAKRGFESLSLRYPPFAVLSQYFVRDRRDSHSLLPFLRFCAEMLSSSVVSQAEIARVTFSRDILWVPRAIARSVSRVSAGGSRLHAGADSSTVRPSHAGHEVMTIPNPSSSSSKPFARPSTSSCVPRPFVASLVSGAAFLRCAWAQDFSTPSS